MLRKSWWAVALLALGGGAVPAHAAVKLQWKFKQGDKFYVATVTKLKQTIDIMGNKVKDDSVMTVVSRYTVKEQSDEATVLEQRIESMAAKAKGEAGEGQEKVADLIKGAVFTLTLSPQGKVTKLTGYKELVDKIAKEDKDTGKMFQVMFSPETFKASAHSVFGFLPAKAVEKDAKWQKEVKIPLGPLGSFKAVNKYTYTGDGREGIQISVTGKLTYARPDKKAAAGAPFKVTKGKIASTQFKGTVVFDAKRGRLVRSETKLVLEGTVTVDVMKNLLDMKIEQESTTTDRVSDKPPRDE
jgi:hypothetical protein